VTLRGGFPGLDAGAGEGAARPGARGIEPAARPGESCRPDLEHRGGWARSPGTRWKRRTTARPKSSARTGSHCRPPPP